MQSRGITKWQDIAYWEHSLKRIREANTYILQTSLQKNLFRQNSNILVVERLQQLVWITSVTFQHTPQHSSETQDGRFRMDVKL